MVEHFNEDEIICPHCNYEYSDSWEFDDSDGEEYECETCGEKFTLTTETIRKYTTKRIDCGDDKHDLEDEPKYYTITTRDWDWKNDTKMPLPKDKWKYWEQYNCKKCDERIYKNLTEEEFKVKHEQTYNRIIKEKMEKEKCRD